MASRDIAVLFGFLIGCGPQVAVDDVGTDTGEEDSGTSRGTSTSGVPQPTTDTPPGTTTASPTTSGSPTTASTVTTSPPDDDDDDWDDDDCNSGGQDCCEVNSNFCDTTTGGVVPEISGEFLFVFSLSVAPDLPLQYLATIDVVSVVEPEGVLFDVSLQPLTLDPGSTTTPREPFGDPIEVLGVLVGGDLSFELPLGSMFAPGVTNPITGSDITMETVLMTGTVLGTDDLCGTASGDVVSPILASLEGSTFAMTRVEVPDALPEMFPLGCN